MARDCLKTMQGTETAVLFFLVCLTLQKAQKMSRNKQDEREQCEGIYCY